MKLSSLLSAALAVGLSSTSFAAIPAFYCSLYEINALDHVDGLVEGLHFEAIIGVQRNENGFFIMSENCSANVAIEYPGAIGDPTTSSCADFKLSFVDASCRDRNPSPGPDQPGGPR